MPDAAHKFADQPSVQRHDPMSLYDASYVHYQAHPAAQEQYKTHDDFHDAVQHRINEHLRFSKVPKHGDVSDSAVKKMGAADAIQAERMRSKVHDWLVESGRGKGAIELRAGVSSKTGSDFVNSLQDAKHLGADERVVRMAGLHQKDHRADADALARLSQRGLPAHLTLYRGTHGGELQKGAKLDEITSFTTDRNVAAKAGSHVISVRVPRENVVLHHQALQHMGFHDSSVQGLGNKEKEVVVRTHGLKIGDG